ncbi:MAG TPA: hypothetical protein VF042_08530 [Gemmatimonadaceae bacterium]
MTESDILGILSQIFEDDEWPEAVRVLRGLLLVRGGMPVTQAARSIRTTNRTLQKIIDAEDPISAALGGVKTLDELARKKAARALGQMLLGRAAEMAFLQLFRDAFKDEELDIVDVSEEGSDTDIRLTDGKGRALYRINIKYFGAVFRRAPEMVGLSADDCFALATYKIKSGIEKQQTEGKPYFFAIVGVAGMTADTAGAQFPHDLMEAAIVVLNSNAKQRRRFEDSLIDHVVQKDLPVFSYNFKRIYDAPWYILSAERAARLMRDKLFERVFALSIRNFTRVFPGAEVDMHFSLKSDLTRLPVFFETLRDEGREKVATLLSRGDL